jgi:hypothetical protein
MSFEPDAHFGKYSVKYKYVYDDVFLIAEIDPNSGKQWLIMRKIEPRTLRVLLEDRIHCIHTAVTTIAPHEFEKRVSEENFAEDMLKIRSTEQLREIQLELDDKFFAFKSWVAGIAESGVHSITIQSEIEQYGHLFHPIANRLFNFLLRAKTDFIKQFLIQMERECRLDGEYHKPSIHANLLKLLPIMILEENEAWNIWRDQVKTNYTWSEEWKLYLINQFDELMDAVYELQPSAQIFLEQDKLHFVLMLPKSQTLPDWEETTQNSVFYNNKFIIPYKHEETGLITLDLWGKKIPNIATIKNFDKLTDIEVLHLEVNLLKKIEGLDHLTSLRELYISNNYIGKIEGLEKLKNLELLKLAYNSIEKIEGLDQLTNLKTLYLFNNKFKKIEGLENLTNLEVLNIAWNEIDKITGLENLKSLKKLNLGGNKLMKVEGLEKLVLLDELILFCNEFQEKPDLDFLPNLVELDLKQNPFNKDENY